MPALRDLDSHWARSLVFGLVGRSMVAGLPDGTFRPDQAVTRAEVARLLAGATGARAVGAPTRFADMRGHWAADAVEALAELGLVRGYPDGTFAPERPVSRIELVALAVRAAGIATAAAAMGSFPAPFADMADVPGWAVGEMAAAAKEGLLRGLFGRNLVPTRAANRAEAATLTARVAARRGALHDAGGVVLSWDPTARQLQLRTRGGKVETIQIPREARTFRQGVPGDAFRPLDQVWVVRGADGAVFHVEARFGEILGQLAEVQGGSLRFIPEGSVLPITVNVAPGAQIFVNGQLSVLGAVHGAGWVYLVLDAGSGTARLVDAVQSTHAGRVVSAVPEGFTIVQGDRSAVEFQYGPAPVIYAGGARAGPDAVRPGQEVLVHASDGRINYLQIQSILP